VDPLKVIAAQPRRRILELVWERERTAGDIARHFDVSWPAISQHLRILRKAGYVTQRRDGTTLYYRADPDALGELRGVIEAQWRAGLGRLKSIVESDQQEESP
jgi:DNA-binding transcriptional ArsR family regulator